MGSEASCCFKGSSIKEFVSMDNNNDDGNLLLKLQHQIIQETEENTLYDEDVLFQLYELIDTDQTDKLQQFIYDHEIDLSTVFWKV